MGVKVDFVVKLGGSAITDKSTLETAKHEDIRKAAQNLLSCWRLGRKFVIVHGAGYVTF